MGADPKLILNLTQSRIVCEYGALAARPLQRLRGLLGQDSLSPGQGLLLWPAPSIHTAFMRFAVDAVFVDRDLRVVKIIERLRPWRIAFVPGARGTLELAAGEANMRGIELGDRLGVFDLDWRHASGGSNGLAQGPNGRGDASGGGDHERPPARVVVLGSDERFRAVAAALLTRRGCAVTLAEPSADARTLLRKSGADVVVLDADASLTAAARKVAQLQAVEPPVGVVVVSEDPESKLSTMPVVEKWGSFAALCDAIESARPRRAPGDPSERD
jgi:uncharacterized protein